MKKRAAVLLLLGGLQITGDLLHLPFLKDLGAATGASPAPKVFCAVHGYEAYATNFFLEWMDAAGDVHSKPISADAAGRLRGPYNRRNIYGAVLAYGPILPERLRQPVLTYALSGNRPVLGELGIDPKDARSVWVRYEPLWGLKMDSLPRILTPGNP
jgi:hypothetical protein